MSYGTFDNDSISPETFQGLLMPTWARLYIEVSAELNDPSIAWFSDSVKDEFIALTGIDPRRAQFGSLDQQQKCLAIARELRNALYEADENAQLDGRDALDFASGWMSANDQICALAGPAGADILETLLAKAIAGGRYKNIDAFKSGFVLKYNSYSERASHG